MLNVFYNMGKCPELEPGAAEKLTSSALRQLFKDSTVKYVSESSILKPNICLEQQYICIGGFILMCWLSGNLNDILGSLLTYHKGVGAGEALRYELRPGAL
jgi:hypothetical protein